MRRRERSVAVERREEVVRFEVRRACIGEGEETVESGIEDVRLDDVVVVVVHHQCVHGR